MVWTAIDRGPVGGGCVCGGGDDYRGCYVIGEKFDVNYVTVFDVTVFDVPVFDVNSPFLLIEQTR